MSSVDNVTVSLSRLALAKAIKTPDDDDKDAEPWTKSIIFYQSHIPQSMRETVQNPHRRMRLPPGMPRHRKALNTSPREQPATDAQDFERNGRKPARNDRRSRPSSTQHLQQQQMTKRNHKAPHNIQGAVQPEILDDNNTINDASISPRSSSSASSEARTPTPNNLTRSKLHRQVPSDDEDESDEEDIQSGKDENDDTDTESEASEQKQHDQKSAHLASTLLHLEKGPSSIHQRSRSLGDLQQASPPPAPRRQHTSSTASSSNESSSHSSGTLRPNSAQRRPSHNRHTSLVDLEHLHQQSQLEMHLQQAQQIAQMHQYQHAMQNYVFQQQCMRPLTPNMYTPQQPLIPTVSFYHHSNQSAPKRSSLSAMDMMIQREQEKEKADTARRRPKKIDSSNAQIEGILARLPEKGTHNINFQAAVMKSKQQHRMSSGEVRSRRSQSPHAGNSSLPTSRPSSTLYVYNQHSTDARRRADIRRSNMDPTPTQSMSTPQSRQHIKHPVAPQQQQQQQHFPHHYHHHQQQQYAPIAYPIMPVMNPPIPTMSSPLNGMEFISPSPIPDQRSSQQWKSAKRRSRFE